MVVQVEGQIYIPEANWLMMVLTVIVVAVFKTTTQLGNAYGKGRAWYRRCSAAHCINALTASD